MVKEGATAPAFKTTDTNGESVSLKDFRGQKVVLYFYPKDDTPGCTKEACSFRDGFSKFKKRGITILGVSPDSEKSHSTGRYRSLDSGCVWRLRREEIYGPNVHGYSSNNFSDRREGQDQESVRKGKARRSC